MDKIVWMLLITALTTQALQIAGVINAPKGLQEITYTQVCIIIIVIIHSNLYFNTLIAFILTY